MDVLVLTDAQIDDWTPTCGTNLVALVVPRSCQERFYRSKAWTALRPALRNGILAFVGPDHWYEIHPQSLVTFRDEADCYTRYMNRKTDRGVYLDIKPGVVDRTVEVVAGWMFADVDEQNRVLGVELLR